MSAAFDSDDPRDRESETETDTRAEALIRAVTAIPGRAPFATFTERELDECLSASILEFQATLTGWRSDLETLEEQIGDLREQHTAIQAKIRRHTGLINQAEQLRVLMAPAKVDKDGGGE